jgi:hypothetical protein
MEKAVPLFKNGELSTASPRSFVSQNRFDVRADGDMGAWGGIPLLDMLILLSLRQAGAPHRRFNKGPAK